MLITLRRKYAEFITSGAQLLILIVALRLGSRSGWLYCLALMAMISLFAWLSALYRLRAIRDTPTSKIGSAAQGYVELVGRGTPFDATPMISKLRLLPCLWYRYKVERNTSKNKWVTEESGESYDSFKLQDGSGVCIVDPELAEIITTHRDQWRIGDYRYTEWKLIKGDKIYVLGEFRTQSWALEFNSRAELNELLVKWKQDMPELRRRFDLNEDGELDMDEWMLARQAAKREVANMRRVAHTQPDIHLIGQPRDRKLFLISNLTPEKLSRRYLLWTWLHLLIILGSLIGMGWVWQSGASM